ncbi:tRNA (adenosine(37)-N6)-threonylcarbamoyltransferase complex dimerization subunit type 1 TsaB [Crocosphaera sp. UHCC 0190]|uniref:tRNA (adenosine(37)-N6)-threonylcarbamoyltransferase complex dimerization subunit type 1 TsaB n=1 Tax=Crocosphaera sp. UHCC 0190 TaxID=3110246 RepID=UPI002B1E9D23|nr:tRNA (adenosine(37)-N6)-threonylcarbamoyltransferase complex dimerization subunit type 1 TsaB [Crocosphaera sp. UHCC 0190]MEA5508998.1 tRNA (adenosine(37)-N6)-threonylcarbamoyltransferase complex dimerization subunit type 1 TsaB [Crocosphaera sp. UHCC 0190]
MTFPNFHQYGLALHTSSSQLGLSLSDFAQDTYTKTWDLDRELSNYLHQYLLDFIDQKTWQHFKFIAVAKGPGSFTSSRIGVVTARTLAQQLNIPLFGVSTLAAFAWFHQDKYDINSPIPVQMKASRGQLYGAIYTKNTENTGLKTILEDSVMMPEEWTQKLQDLQIFSQPLITPLALGMTANSVLELADYDWQQGKRPHWSEVIPFYGMSVVT